MQVKRKCNFRLPEKKILSLRALTQSRRGNLLTTENGSAKSLSGSLKHI
ncbi:MAG: hypothetical protein J5680_07515 [Neisseriaceae bacterium]|nr:hypothetical protein [Neisseriaceae bacterium]